MGDVDEPRYLARTVGYTPASHRSIDPAAECVDEDEQRRQTQKAYLAWKREQARQWGTAATLIISAVNGLSDPQLRRGVRPIIRVVARISRDVQLGD